MDFSIGEDRQMLVDTLSRYLADKADWKAREAAIESDTGFDKAMWQGMAELGILGALFGEEVGGFGGSPFDIGVVFGEVGKALPPGPFLATLMAGKLLEAAGDAETLGNVIAGASIATFAHEPAVSADGSVAPQASASGSGDSWTVNGAKGVVDYLGSADVVVVTADTGNGLAAFLVEAGASGVEIRDYPLVDGGAATGTQTEGRVALPFVAEAADDTELGCVFTVGDEEGEGAAGLHGGELVRVADNERSLGPGEGRHSAGLVDV